MPFKDQEKRRKYRREWYAKNKISEKKHIRRRRGEIKEWFKKYRSELFCTKCGENHPATMDFHHYRGKKEKQITDMVRWGYSIENIKKEIEKCQVLCANCHRKVHWKNNKPLKPS